MNPRLNRLKADYQKMQELVSRSKLIQIIQTEGSPPEKYIILLKCRGIVGLDNNEKPVFGSSHQLGIHLHQDYPRKGPVFQMLTPVFHPNINANGAICIGDEGDHGFAPNMGLDDLIVNIMHIIRYENFGIDKPFNMVAASWARKNSPFFPLETTQIITEEYFDINILGDLSNNENINITIDDGEADSFNIQIS